MNAPSFYSYLAIVCETQVRLMLEGSTGLLK